MRRDYATTVKPETAKKVAIYALANGVEKATKHFKITEKATKQYVASYRQMLKDENKNENENTTDYKEHLNELGITEDQVSSVKYWQTQKGQVRYSIVTKRDYSLDEMFERFQEKMKDYKPPTVKKLVTKYDNTCAIINLFDAHIDKLPFPASASPDVFQKFLDEYSSAYEVLLNNAATFKPEMIIIPIGNDMLNTNGFHSRTKKGTELGQQLVTHDKAFIEAIGIVREQIDKARQFAKVKIIVVRGNHDRDVDFYLGYALSIIYENCDDVDVNYSLSQRKYVRFGNNLFGFAHGDIEKRKINSMPLIMAEEMKKDWGETKYREWYLGDIHHKQDYNFLRVKDSPGVTVRFLRSVGINDDWSHENGFIGVHRTAESYIWHKEKGLIANFSINL